MDHFFKLIIEPAASCLKPASVVKVGCASEDCAHDLLRLCEKNRATLHLIEKQPGLDVAELEKKHESHLVFHQSLALNALPEIERMDMVLMDGDPNWYTVFNALKLIEKRVQGFPCVLVASVGWPYGRRDCYLDPEVIPEAFRHPHKQKGVVPGENDLAEAGGMFADRFHAIYQNELKNGVLTAVEDFLRESEHKLLWVMVPWNHGLGLLYPEELGKTNPGFAALVGSLSASEPVAALIEELERDRNRVEAELQGMKAEIDGLEERCRVKVDDLQKTMGEQVARLKETVSSGEKVEKELRGKLETLQAQSGKSREQLGEKERELAGLSRRLAAMEEEREGARAELRSRLDSEISVKDAEIEQLRELLRGAEAERDRRAGEVDNMRKQLMDQSRLQKKMETDNRHLKGRLRQLLGLTENLSMEIEKHLHSWTWRIGSGVLGPVRRLAGRENKPVDSLRINRTLRAFQAWKDAGP